MAACRALFVLAWVASALLSGCATYRPRPPAEVGLLERAHSQRADDIRVTVAVPTDAQIEALFGVPLASVGIQPVWLEIDNGSARTYTFAPIALDSEYFTPPLSVTHQVDPDVDEARDYLVQDLLRSQFVARLGWVRGVGVAPPWRPRVMADGTTFFTDGLRAVMILSTEALGLDEIEFLDWDAPPATDPAGPLGRAAPTPRGRPATPLPRGGATSKPREILRADG